MVAGQNGDGRVTRSRFFDDSGYPAAVMQGLLSRTMWDSGQISYYLEPSDANDDGLNDWDQNGAAEAIRLAFQLWADVSGLTFTEVASAAAANMVERTYNEEATDGRIVLGRHFFPGQNDDPTLASDGTQNYGEYNVNGDARWNAATLAQGGSSFTTILHEIGHGIGLEHPHDTDLYLGVSDSEDTGYFGLNQGIYTTMTYNDGWTDGGGPTSRSYGWQGTPMALDIAAVQAVYGANMSFRTGDDAYALPGSNGTGAFYSSIWDAGGTDTITYDGFNAVRIFLDDATIDDTPTGGGLLSYVEGIQGGFTIAQGAIIENASGGLGDDLIAGNEAANTLDGNEGDDVLVGLGGADIIRGGAGDDLIIGDYETVATFGVAVTPDPADFVAADLPSGLSVGSGQLTLDGTEGNNSRGGAEDLSDDFALQRTPTFQDGDEFFYVTVDATSGDGFAYYSFTITEQAFIVIDIDGGHGASGTPGAFDSYLYLEDASGAEIASNDDTAVDFGSFDSYRELGQGSGTYDSGLSVTLDAGTYYIRLGQWGSGNVGVELDAGSTYTMHVLADTFVTAEPPTIPSGALEQLGYYYETPDFSSVIGGYNGAAASNQAVGKDGAVHNHGEGCACSHCHSREVDETLDEGTLPEPVIGGEIDWDAVRIAFGDDALSLGATTPSGFASGGTSFGYEAPIDPFA